MIELTGLTKTFQLGDQIVRAVNGVDLTIERGEYVSVMGPSGSGKSTLLNMIALLDRPSAGNYLLNGTDVTSLSDDELADQRQRNIGFIFQFFHLIGRMSAAQNVELPMLLAGIASKERQRRVSESLQALGLQDRAHHKPNELSGGQRQRVAIARATIMSPRLLLADEPTGNLDSESGRQVVDILERLHTDEGMTLIVVTHDAALGQRASRRIRIVDGKIDQDERG